MMPTGPLPVAASSPKSTERDVQPASGEARPQANLHRVVRVAPPHIREQARRHDLALNQLRRQNIEPSRLERIVTVAAIWLCIFIVGYFIGQGLRGWFS